MGFSLTLTPDGARRMAQASAANNGRRIAIMLDGRAIVVPTMNGKMSDRLLIDLNIPAEKGDREDLIGQLDAAINALPTTEPAAGNAIK
jgi:preprotein translocase subunit SecD